MMKVKKKKVKKGGLTYFSLFSGIGGFELGIQKVFPKAKCVGFSEISLGPINVYQSHFPGHKNYGDIAKLVWKHDKDGNMLADKRDRPILNKKALDALPNFDMLVGGSPCQGLSRANITRRDLADPRSRLFYAYLHLYRYKKPKFFILENVASMKNEIKDTISRLLGVEPIRLDSALVSAGHRERLYWCNWNVSEPDDKGIEWKHVKQSKGTKAYLCKDREKEFIEEVERNKKTHWLIEKGYKKSSLHAYSRSIRDIKRNGKKIGTNDERRFRKNGKLNTLVTSRGCGGSHAKNFVKTKWGWRILTPTECARVQCFPDDWCSILSDAQAYKAFGNAVTVDMIAHIMSCHPLAKRKV